MSLSSTLRSLPADAASRLLGAALVGVGVPAPISAVVAAAAPKALALLADLLDEHARGAPLPPVLRVDLPDDTRIVSALVEADLDEEQRDTWPGPGGSP